MKSIADRLTEKAFDASTKLWDGTRAVRAFVLDNQLPKRFQIGCTLDRLAWAGAHAACDFEVLVLRAKIEVVSLKLSLAEAEYRKSPMVTDQLTQAYERALWTKQIALLEERRALQVRLADLVP